MDFSEKEEEIFYEKYNKFRKNFPDVIADKYKRDVVSYKIAGAILEDLKIEINNENVSKLGKYIRFKYLEEEFKNFNVDGNIDKESMKKMMKLVDHEIPYDPRFVKNVKYIYLKMFDIYECKQCGNCCMGVPPSITKKDIDRISKKLKMKPDKFKKQYVTEITDDPGNKYKFKFPCPFYNSEKSNCDIYDFCPEICKAYPFVPFSKKQIYNLQIAIDDCNVVKEFSKDFKQFGKEELNQEIDGEVSGHILTDIITFSHFFMYIMEKKNIKIDHETYRVLNELMVQIDKYW